MAKIMIVEDDPMISEIYNRKFSEAGFEVFLAENGKQALESIDVKKIDIILSDIIMPEMDGLELVKILRGPGYDPRIKIIILSNLTDSRENIISLGANGFLAKSAFTPSEIVIEVKKILDAQAQPAQ